ncbi:MAG: response regulator [Calditrichaceae bacterium]|nr:response regulator [Calditrichaceae bacterium]
MLDKRVLLVDDEASLRRTLGLNLMQCGYETEPCPSGIEALKKINLYAKNNIPIDYIVCDIKLPDIDGMKLFRVIKYRHPDIPVILITGYPDKYDSEEIKELHVDGYLEKPLSADDLIKKFETYDMEHNRTWTDANKIPAETGMMDLAITKSMSAYIMIKMDDNTDMFNAYKELYFMDHTLYCDMTTGDYDIIMLIQADDLKKCRELCENKIHKIPGVSNIDYLEISHPVFDDNLSNVMITVEEALFKDNSKILKKRLLQKNLSSYVLLQVEKEKLETIFPSLYLDDNVVYCDYTYGKYNMILLMQGSNFGEIENVINEKIMALDGVLQIKKFPIISGFEGNF